MMMLPCKKSTNVILDNSVGDKYSFSVIFEMMVEIFFKEHAENSFFWLFDRVC